VFSVMAKHEYRQRIQRALDYIETHLELQIALEQLAGESSFSPNHFIWIFKTVTGHTPLGYVRNRKMTEAARAVLGGDDIVDTVYRFGFSAQDSFTRSFAATIGEPPEPKSISTKSAMPMIASGYTSPAAMDTPDAGSRSRSSDTIRGSIGFSMPECGKRTKRSSPSARTQMHT
jgi:AraC-like DNA-binding protein